MEISVCMRSGSQNSSHGGISSHEKRFDWATVGQRLFHQNDVRSMFAWERDGFSGGVNFDFAYLVYVEETKSICTDVFIQNFWESQSHNKDDDGSGSSPVTCMLATTANLYYSEGEFVVRRLNFHQKSTEILGKKKCWQHIEDIDLNLADASLNDSMDEGLEMQIELVKDLKFQYTAIECVFVSDYVVLFLCAELDSQLAFFNVSTQKCVKVLSKVDDQKGRPVMHLKVKTEPKSFISNGKSDSWRKFGCKLEPFWGFKAALAKKINKERKRRSSESSNDRRNVLLLEVSLKGIQQQSYEN
uniref:Uncharacterized protein n=1 Tax=Ditylenchus dipsaci TaxID=166011 RepID=A0A915E431_9BILA